MQKWRANYQNNRVKKLTLEKIDKVKEIDQKILDILPQEESEKKLEDILVLEDLNFELLAKIDRCLKKSQLGYHQVRFIFLIKDVPLEPLKFRM